MSGVTNWGDAVFLSLTNALNSFLNAIPQVIGALLIIIIGWVISNILARLVREVLERGGADRLFAEHGGAVYGTRSSAFQPSIVAAEVVKWIVRFIFLVAAANVLGLTQVSVLLNDVLLWIPNLIVAAVILLVAPRTRGCSAVSPRSPSLPSRSSSPSTSSGSPRTSSTSCSSASWPRSRSRSAWRSAWAVAMWPRGSPRTGMRA